MNTTIYILIILFVINILIPFMFLDDKVDKLVLRDYIVPVLLIVTDVYCLVISNIFVYEIFEKILIIILGIISIIVSLISFIAKITKKNNHVITLLKCASDIYKIEDLFDIQNTHTSYHCIYNEGCKEYNLEINNGKHIIVNKEFILELIPKKELGKDELKFIIEQLNKNCQFYLIGDENIKKLKEYKVALFKVKSLYTDYKNIDFDLLEKVKGEK